MLSVQVHPPDEFARSHDPHDDGKTEMFYILGAQPDAAAAPAEEAPGEAPQKGE